MANVSANENARLRNDVADLSVVCDRLSSNVNSDLERLSEQLGSIQDNYSRSLSDITNSLSSMATVIELLSTNSQAVNQSMPSEVNKRSRSNDRPYDPPPSPATFSTSSSNQQSESPAGPTNPLEDQRSGNYVFQPPNRNPLSKEVWVDLHNGNSAGWSSSRDRLIDGVMALWPLNVGQLRPTAEITWKDASFIQKQASDLVDKFDNTTTPVVQWLSDLIYQAGDLSSNWPYHIFTKLLLDGTLCSGTARAAILEERRQIRTQTSVYTFTNSLQIIHDTKHDPATACQQLEDTILLYLTLFRTVMSRSDIKRKIKSLTLLNRDLRNFKALWHQIIGFYYELEAQDRDIALPYEALCRCLESTGNNQVQQHFAFKWNFLMENRIISGQTPFQRLSVCVVSILDNFPNLPPPASSKSLYSSSTIHTTTGSNSDNDEDIPLSTLNQTALAFTQRIQSLKDNCPAANFTNPYDRRTTFYCSRCNNLLGKHRSAGFCFAFTKDGEICIHYLARRKDEVLHQVLTHFAIAFRNDFGSSDVDIAELESIIHSFRSKHVNIGESKSMPKLNMRQYYTMPNRITGAFAILRDAPITDSGY